MDTRSEQAAVEIRIEWEDNDIRHANREYFDKLSFWRDIFPGSLSRTLPGSDGNPVSEQFPAGELVPPWSAGNIHAVKLNRLKLQRKHGPPIEIHRGQHYPRYIAAGTAGIFAGNLQPALPFADRQFDALICTASVEYLTQAVAVFRELGRVLKPGAPAIMTFSDRWFPTKVIARWTELHPFERLAMVQEYFRAAGCFTDMETKTLHGLPRPEDDKYARQQAFSDPVYAVWARAVDQGSSRH